MKKLAIVGVAAALAVIVVAVLIGRPGLAAWGMMVPGLIVSGALLRPRRRTDARIRFIV